jgi:hypothetical protein
MGDDQLRGGPSSDGAGTKFKFVRLHEAKERPSKVVLRRITRVVLSDVQLDVVDEVSYWRNRILSVPDDGREPLSESAQADLTRRVTSKLPQDFEA